VGTTTVGAKMICGKKAQCEGGNMLEKNMLWQYGRLTESLGLSLDPESSRETGIVRHGVEITRNMLCVLAIG
jgi:hypothetical protein